jgi:hypothetical protein
LKGFPVKENQIQPSIEIELAGKTRRLVFDFNAQAAFEQIAGVSVFDKKAMRISSRMVRALLWAELLHFDEEVSFDEFGEIVSPPELSLNAVGNLITRDNLREVNRKVFEAFSAFFKAAKKDDAKGDDAKNPPSR